MLILLKINDHNYYRTFQGGNPKKRFRGYGSVSPTQDKACCLGRATGVVIVGGKIRGQWLPTCSVPFPSCHLIPHLPEHGVGKAPPPAHSHFPGPPLKDKQTKNLSLPFSGLYLMLLDAQEAVIPSALSLLAASTAGSPRHRAGEGQKSCNVSATTLLHT